MAGFFALPGATEIFVFWGALFLLVVIPMWRICGRLGFPPVLSLLFAIPLVNLVLLWVLAFARTAGPMDEDRRSGASA